jgi:hypothetical protein
MQAENTLSRLLQLHTAQRGEGHISCTVFALNYCNKRRFLSLGGGKNEGAGFSLLIQKAAAAELPTKAFKIPCT